MDIQKLKDQAGSLPEHVRLQMATNQLVNKAQPMIVGAALLTEFMQIIQSYQNVCNAYFVEITELKKKTEEKS